MKVKGYKYATDTSHLIYTFNSVGRQGIITKVIVYEPVQDNLYNLAFGDYDSDSGNINDLNVSNNGDTVKVLATVIHTIETFFQYFPDAELMIRGSSDVRIRLYQRIILKNMPEIEPIYTIWGLTDDGQIVQMPYKAINFDEFRILKKKIV